MLRTLSAVGIRFGILDDRRQDLQDLVGLVNKRFGLRSYCGKGDESSDDIVWARQLPAKVDDATGQCERTCLNVVPWRA